MRRQISGPLSGTPSFMPFRDSGLLPSVLCRSLALQYMKGLRTLLAACVLIAACLPVALGQRRASDPEIKLTCLNHDETISKQSSYPITWTAQNIPTNTMLSLRLDWPAQASGVRGGGLLQKTETSWLIAGLLDSASQRRLAALSPSAADVPTIESGRCLWDVNKFCKQNREGRKSICDADVHYRLQLILRSADDPCADKIQCGKPRSLFKVYISHGTLSFRH